MKFGAFCTCVFHMTLSHAGNMENWAKAFLPFPHVLRFPSPSNKDTRAHIGYAPSAGEVKIEN